jgi:peptidoglycan/xylan/chitin deacetylase (PgdA/CDA1 family)
MRAFVQHILMSAVLLPAIPAIAADPTPSSPEPMAMKTPAQPPVQGTEHTSFNSVHVDQPVIAITFDDGPSAVLTPRLLDILKQRNIKATFFVLGQLVNEHPEIVQRAVAEGHEIGNHSWDHKALNKVGEGGLRHELADTSAVISKVAGKPVTLMRPPYGATNPRLNRAIEKEYGMKVIIWSVDPLDWKRPGPQVVEQRILKETQPGSIILAHDIHPGTIEAMPATLDALLAKGYRFVTVSELLSMDKPKPEGTPLQSATPGASPATGNPVKN